VTGEIPPTAPEHLPGVRAPMYRSMGGSEATGLPPAKPVPTEQLGTRVVMDEHLWQIAENLRTIRWPKIWLDRLATSLLGLAIAAGLSGADQWHADSHSVLFGMHYGYFVLAILALVFSLLFYMADKGYRDNPLNAVQRVLRLMERLQWIKPLEDDEQRGPVSLRQWLLNVWNRRIWGLNDS
jgi:hypothetical protein